MKEKKKPLYRQMMDDLIRRIEQGEYKQDEPFPTQIELAKLYGTSEITSRRALSELVSDGYIYRTRGKGTFLTPERSGESVKQEIRKGQSMRTVYFAYHTRDLHIFNHRFYSDMLVGLHEVCKEFGIELRLWDLGAEFELPRDSDAGIVLLPGGVPVELLKKWKEDERKLVTVHFYYPHLQIPYVIVDNLTGGYLATEHLLSLGHERIGIILTGNSAIDMNQEFSLRLQGYKLALAQHNLEFDPELVCVIKEDLETEEMGYTGFQTLMALQQPPTGIFATSDLKAFGVLRAAKERNLRVPDDISVVGYDDLLVSPFLMPGLTTMNQNSNLLGRRAAELLILGANADNMRDEIVPRLVVRESTQERQSSGGLLRKTQ